MNFLGLAEIIKAARLNEVKLLSVEVSAKDFKALKADANVISRYQMPGKLKPNELMVYGVKVIGRLCECGAHPEDWE